MKPLSLCLVLVGCASLALAADQQQPAPLNRKDVSEEMQLINKSLEGLLSELATIRREATGRLSQVKSKQAAANDQQRIRQTKVSRFVLKRVAELELESLGMRDEMAKLFELQRKTLELPAGAGTQGKQDDDFDSEPAAGSSTPAPGASSSAKPVDEQEAAAAAQIGFDLEQLKRLGKQLESELEARQAQGAESVRGVHEQVIRLVDNMVQNYLGNMRRAVQRFTNFIDNRRQPPASGPRQSPPTGAAEVQSASVHQTGAAILGQLEDITKRFREFTLQWSKTLGKQQSPLIDRIPPRGVELWRDFWDTVRKQVRRVNEEFWQLSRDMTRVISGRLPSTGTRVVIRPGGRDQEEGAGAAANLGELLYAAASSRDQTQQQVRQQFEQFYEKLSSQLSREQQRIDELSKAAAAGAGQQQQQQLDQNLFDELDDEVTRQELANNVALRQQIQQEINVFGSIFDIMRTFIARLRDSASTIRDILTPPGAPNDNNSVTPGPAVKPTVDKLIEDAINSQRNINSQARPTSRD